MQLPALTLPPIPHFAISLFVSLPVLVGIFILFLLVYGAISAVLIYHWVAYGMGSFGIWIGATLYIFISLVLFSVSLSALHYF